MDELFRFALSRPAEQTAAQTLVLERPTKLQQELQSIAESDPSRKQWGRFRATASEYLTKDPSAVRVRVAMTTLKDGDANTAAIRGDIAAVRKFHELLRNELAANPEPPWPQTAFDMAEPLFQSNYIGDLHSELCDLFIALMLFRSAGPQIVPALQRKNEYELLALYRNDRPSLHEVAELLRSVDLVFSLKMDSNAFTTSAAFLAALRRTLELPPKVFGRRSNSIHAVGVTDLLVVKQHIHHYELGEIARIENIMKGETRGHTQKHTLSTERESIFESETETQTDQELTSLDHVSIRNEVDTLMKEDTSVNSGVHVQYDGGSYKIQADVTVAYNRSSSTAKKSATEIAKDVTQRAAKRVNERVRQSTRTKVVETFEENETQAFTNPSGPHVSGVYQWLQKVYLAQVFNYGKHLMFDIMVPEPGASLISAATAPIDPQEEPVAPDALLLSPLDLTDDPSDKKNFYGIWIAKFGVTGVEPPPPASITVPALKIMEFEDDTAKQWTEVVRITEGYVAAFANVTLSWFGDDDRAKNSYVDLTVGKAPLLIKWDAANTVNGDRYIHVVRRDIVLNPPGAVAPGEEREIGYTFHTGDVSSMTLNLEIVCTRSPTLFARWQLQTYDKIATRWYKLQEDYEAKRAALKFQKKQEGILGAADPEMNRQTERIELKRSAIAILASDKELVDGQNEVVPTPPIPGRPAFFDPSDSSQSTGSLVRFLEQAFEWDKISYVLYPYFWGRAAQWLGSLQRKHDDPLFESFLRAGYARVVIPVRNGFEDAVNFFMVTGEPWLGGDLPTIGDKTYLPITEELREQSGAPGDEIPVGDPWFIQIATRTIKLRTGNEKAELPRWKRVPDHADPPEGSWTWKEDV